MQVTLLCFFDKNLFTPHIHGSEGIQEFWDHLDSLSSQQGDDWNPEFAPQLEFTPRVLMTAVLHPKLKMPVEWTLRTLRQTPQGN